MNGADACEIEELEHTAEIGVRVRAPSPEALFACAALALGVLAESCADASSALRSFDVAVESDDPESLLVDWLSEVLYLQETSGATVSGVDVFAWSPTRVEARLTAGNSSAAPRLHFKGVTYHGLRVVQTATGWLADVYLDI